MPQEGFKRKLTAILSADAVGYSRLMGEDEEATVRTITTYREVLSTLIRQHNGRVVDSPGDNLLAEFVSVVDSVQCAVAVQKEIKARNDELPEDRRMQFRIGINLGDVIQEEERLYGDGVNIAARLEGLADHGGICISKTAFDQIESKLPYGYDFIGDQTVKNIAKPVGAYRVIMEPRVTVSGKSVVKKPAAVRRMPILVGAVAVLVLVVAAGIWHYYPRPPKIEPASVENMAHPLPNKPSIAVLAFDNLSGDTAHYYIADGISENIITALSYIPQLLVIARNSSFTYKGKPVKVQQVSEELGVRYVLEGSVLKSGERIRVTAQLIDALSGVHIWSKRYDREMKNIFNLLDEITQSITVALQIKLTHGEQAHKWYGSAKNLEVFDYAVKGLDDFYGYNKESIIKSRVLYKKALEIDPEYVHALTMLAWTHFIDARHDYTDSREESLKHAIKLAKKAVALKGSDPLVHSLWQHIHLIQKQHDMAIEEGRRAIALGPNNAEVHILFCEALYRSGKFEESVKMCEKAKRLHPYAPLYYFGHMMNAYYWVERYEDSLDMADNLIFSDIPKLVHWGHWGVARAYIRLGQEKKARKYVAYMLQQDPIYGLYEDRKNSLYKPELLEQDHADLRKAGMPELAPAK
jgi:adenylate cyclase